MSVFLLLCKSWRVVTFKLLLQSGRRVQTTLFCCCPKHLMFYIRAHLKDLSVTLIRAVVNAWQCFLSIQRASACTNNDLLGEKKCLYL